MSNTIDYQPTIRRQVAAELARILTNASDNLLDEIFIIMRDSDSKRIVNNIQAKVDRRVTTQNINEFLASAAESSVDLEDENVAATLSYIK